jgi:8-oxo-dGTP pyrophosphatase MutT (NUDIX family)
VGRHHDHVDFDHAARSIGDDDSLLSAAVRELNEETGVSWEDIAELPDVNAIPVDIDVHSIPANPAKSEQEHWHADFRYLIKACRLDTITIQAEEVSSYNWLPPSLVQHRRLAVKIALVAAT